MSLALPVYYLFSDLLGLIKVLAELVRLDFPVVGLSYDPQNVCICQRYFQTPILLLFDWQLFLVTYLLFFGGGKEIIY